MLANDEMIYKKAYRELYSVIEILTLEERNRIPNQIIENIIEKMDNTYEFSIEKDKKISEQKLMPQTQALIINLYQKYLSPEEDKEKWKKYNQICYDKCEEEKRKKYNPDNLFENHKESVSIESKQLIIVERKSFVQKIIEKIKKIFRLK